MRPTRNRRIIADLVDAGSRSNASAGGATRSTARPRCATAPREMHLIGDGDSVR
jgi:hypothetical protein